MIDGYAQLRAIGTSPTSMFATMRAFEKMSTPMTAMTSHFAAIQKMASPMAGMTNPMADVITRSIRAAEPVRLLQPMRMFKPLQVFETPMFTHFSTLDLAARRALEWAPLLDENSNTKPIPGLAALLADKRNKIASARLIGAYIRLLLYARDRVGKSPGKVIVSSPQVTRGPDTRSSTFKSTAGLASV